MAKDFKNIKNPVTLEAQTDIENVTRDIIQGKVNDTPQKLKKRVSLVIPAYMWEILQEYAYQHRESVNKSINRFIEDTLKKESFM